MKCPKCVEEGTKSKVMYHGSSTTLMSNSPYYDEEGVYHNHDYNTIRSIYSCSNGHNFETSGKPKCPNCDFGSEEHNIRFFDRL